MRKEKDTLGEINVPEGAYWGAQTQRAVLNFDVSGLKPWPAFVWSIVNIKKAAAEVNTALGLLPEETGAAIKQAADEVLSGQHDDQFVVDPFQAGAGTSHNMNANEVLANRATEILGGGLGEYRVHPNDHVNMSQSTNDVIPTSIRLGVLWRIEELFQVLAAFQGALEEKAQQFDPVVKSGRTHLQDAVPVRLGQEFSGYALAVKKDIARIRQAADGLYELGIGGTAVGSGLNAHPDYHKNMVAQLTKQTGIPFRTSDNLFERMQSMADFVDFSGALRTFALTVTRIANDIRLLSSGPTTGLDEVRFQPVQPGSSIMPGKVNPVMAEMVNMAMYHCIGNDTAVALSAQAGQLELNVMMPIIAHNVFEMMQVMIGSVRAFTDKGIKTLEANEEKAARWLRDNPIVVTSLNPVIGYAAGAALVKESIASGRSLLEVAVAKAEAGELAHVTEGRPVTVEEINQAIQNIRKLTDGGIV